MMQVYLDAMTASQTGSPQYVLEKSLDIFRTDDELSVISALRSGYTATKFISGVMERTWLIAKDFLWYSLDNSRYPSIRHSAHISCDTLHSEVIYLCYLVGFVFFANITN